MRALITVVGQDQIGIIGGVCTKLAALNVNILDISQTVMQEYFTMMMLADLSTSEYDMDYLSAQLDAYGREFYSQLTLS